MILRAIGLAAALLCAASFGAAQDNDNGTIAFDSDDRVMNAAIAAAQESLPLFLCEAVDAEGYGPPDGYLKVRVPVKHPQMTDEIIWVGPFAAWDAINFAGILVNEPVAMPGYKLGDQLDFSYPMIVDWSWYHPSGAQYGDFTTRVIYEQMGNTAALSAFAVPPYPPKWNCD